MSLKLQGRPWSFSDRIMRNRSTHERGELKTFLFLIQLDYWQAVDAENGGDFAAVMDVMFEHTPDDLLARNGGAHSSPTSPPIPPHLCGWLGRRPGPGRRGPPIPPLPRRGEPPQKTPAAGGRAGPPPAA